MKFEIGNKVYRKESPEKHGIIWEIDPDTGRCRVQWAKNRTWNQPKFLVIVPSPPNHAHSRE